ncbi:hypothetical protein [Yoonia sp.]|uniref:hypothetical protein n=1 Tax=Yoonia sp. TaxID=2212373 RepID=UPI00358F12B0
MGLNKLAAKVVEYNERLERGEVSEIKPSHVERVLKKLKKKTAELQADIAAAPSDDKKARLEQKLKIADAHVARAEWLLENID